MRPAFLAVLALVSFAGCLDDGSDAQPTDSTNGDAPDAMAVPEPVTETDSTTFAGTINPQPLGFDYNQQHAFDVPVNATHLHVTASMEWTGYCSMAIDLITPDGEVMPLALDESHKVALPHVGEYVVGWRTQQACSQGTWQTEWVADFEAHVEAADKEDDTDVACDADC